MIFHPYINSSADLYVMEPLAKRKKMLPLDSFVVALRTVLGPYEDEQQRNDYGSKLLDDRLVIKADTLALLSKAVERVDMKAVAMAAYKLAYRELTKVPLHGEHHMDPQGYPAWEDRRRQFLFTTSVAYEWMIQGLAVMIPQDGGHLGLAGRGWVMARGHFAEPALAVITAARLIKFFQPGGDALKHSYGDAAIELGKIRREFQQQTIRIDFQTCGCIGFPVPRGMRPMIGGSPDGIFVVRGTNFPLFMLEFKIVSIPADFEVAQTYDERAKSYKLRLYAHLYQTILNTYITGARCGILSVLHCPPPPGKDIGPNGPLSLAYADAKNKTCEHKMYAISYERCEEVVKKTAIPQMQVIANILSQHSRAHTSPDLAREAQRALRTALQARRAEYSTWFSKFIADVIARGNTTTTPIETTFVRKAMIVSKRSRLEWVRALTPKSLNIAYDTIDSMDDDGLM